VGEKYKKIKLLSQYQQLSCNPNGKKTVHYLSNKSNLYDTCNRHIVLQDDIYTNTHKPFYGPLGFCPGLPGWAGTRMV